MTLGTSSTVPIQVLRRHEDWWSACESSTPPAVVEPTAPLERANDTVRLMVGRTEASAWTLGQRTLGHAFGHPESLVLRLSQHAS